MTKSSLIADLRRRRRRTAINSENISDEIKFEAKRAAAEASPLLVGSGRFGYAVESVVYVLVGLIAAGVVFGIIEKTVGTRGAFRYLIELPFGQFLLVSVAVGLVRHAHWRAVQAFADADHKGSDAKGFVVSRRGGQRADCFGDGDL